MPGSTSYVNISRAALVVLGIISGIYLARRSLHSQSADPKPREKKQRPQTAHHSRRRTVSSVPSSPPDIASEIFAESAQALTDTNSWSADEAESLLALLYSIAEEKAQTEGIVHRSITCNHCNASPVRGVRFKYKPLI
jgi:hypothetical protein